MSRKNLSSTSTTAQTEHLPALANDDFDLQRELDEVERLILQSHHVPLTNITIVNEARLLAQLDRVFENLPAAIVEAKAIARSREEILQQADAYARDLIQRAERQAEQILDETGIVQRAQQDARQIHEHNNIECEQLRQQTLQDIRQMRQQALDECRDLQAQAQDYAAAVLTDLEGRLGGMLQVIRNGHTSLHPQSLQQAES